MVSHCFNMVDIIFQNEVMKMEREQIHKVLHKNRACLMRQMEKECNHNCKECMYACTDEETLKMYDALISMYRPKKSTIKEKWGYFKRYRQMRRQK